MKIKFLLFLSVLCFGCSKIEPRKPINPKPSTTILAEIVAESKILNKIEDDKILQLIKIISQPICFLIIGHERMNGIIIKT